MVVKVKFIKEVEVDLSNKFDEIIEKQLRDEDVSMDDLRELWNYVTEEVTPDAPKINITTNNEQLRLPGVIEIKDMRGKLILER